MSREVSGFHTIRAGRVAFLATDQCSISSLLRSNRLTSCPRAASAALSCSATRFSPLGVPDR